MGGKSNSGGNQAVEEQKKQAAEARAKEEKRKANVAQGMASIKNAFEGSPVMATTSQKYDWGGFKPSTGQGTITRDASGNFVKSSGATGVPAGYTAVQVDDPNYKAPAKTTAKASTQGTYGQYGSPNSKDGWLNQNQYVGGDSGKDAPRMGQSSVASGNNSVSGGGTPGKVWALQGADGKIYYQGQDLSYDTQTDTGQRSGGFGDDFYGDYKQSILDYYTPQVADQYSDAQKELTYRLARAGTIRSSAANTETADLAKQNELNTAQVLNKADQGAADLRQRVQQERANTEAQLYATEDPTAAANQATAAVRNISLDEPDLSPLGAIFNIATVGLNNGAKGYQSGKLSNQYGGGGLPSGTGKYVT